MWQDLLNNRCSNEDCSERFSRRIKVFSIRLVQEWKIEICLETLNLSPEMVSVYPYIETTDKLLAAFLGLVCSLGEQN
jgi:hypothetical protein